MIHIIEALQRLRKYSLNLQPPSFQDRLQHVQSLKEALSALPVSSWERSLPPHSLNHSSEAFPVGVVVLISPQVFPLRATLERWIPSYLAGNATLVKVSSKTPKAAQDLQQLFKQAGIPEDSTIVIQDSREILGDLLLSHPGIRALSFVGSHKVGEEMVPRISVGKKYQMWLGGYTTNLITDSDGLRLALIDLRHQLDEGLWNTPLYPQRWIVIDAIEKETEVALEEIFGSRSVSADTQTFFDQAVSEEGKQRKGWIHHLPLCSLVHQSEVRLPTVTLNSVKYPFDMQKWVNHSSTGYAVQLWGDLGKNQKLVGKFEVGAVTLNTSVNHKDSILIGAKQSILGVTDLKSDGLFFSEHRSVRKID